MKVQPDEKNVVVVVAMRNIVMFIKQCLRKIHAQHKYISSSDSAISHFSVQARFEDDQYQHQLS